MAVMERSGNEILLEQLTKQVAKLVSEQKAKEAIVKELNETIRMAEREMVTRIATAKDRTEKEIEAIMATVTPVKDLQATCERLRREIEELKREKINAATEIKLAKSLEIQRADIVLANRAASLANIQQAMGECKDKVARL